MAPPPGPIPPALPPSVEEAYRRKCIQLKQRMNEVEEANDASRVRLTRMKRGIEKLRLERAFLLEQLAKRTSANVEDSEGSPSPPPTPKEKPLRTKRGHRKPTFLTDLDSTRGASAFVQNNQAITLSPSNSDAFSHTQTTVPRQVVAAPNGTKPPPVSEAPKKPRNGFELFANENRPALQAAHRQFPMEGNYDIDRDLAMKWKELGEGQSYYYRRIESGDYGIQEARLGSAKKLRDTQDEDVEMGDDGEDEEEA